MPIERVRHLEAVKIEMSSMAMLISEESCFVTPHNVRDFIWDSSLYGHLNAVYWDKVISYWEEQANPEKKGTSSYTRNCYVQFPTATHTLAISLEESSSPFIRHSTHSGTPEHCSFGLSIPVAALFSSTSPLQLTADAALLRKGRLPWLDSRCSTT